MARRIVTALSGIVVLAGCVYEEEPAPRITSILTVGDEAPPSSALPKVVEEVHPSVPVPADIPAAWIPPADLRRTWTAIIIHHSATPAGNAAIFD